MRAHVRTHTCTLKINKRSKREAGLRPRCEKPIHQVKEFELHQDNEATSRALKQGDDEI